MKILRKWQKKPNGAIRLFDIGWEVHPGDGWGSCTIDAPLPEDRKSCELSLGKLMGAAAQIENCITDPEAMRHLDSGVTCPVRCLLGWAIRCRRLVGALTKPLTLARMKLPTPPEFCGTIGEPFCQLAINEVDVRCLWLRQEFVTHTDDSLKLSGDERVAYEARQIVSQWNDVARRWEFAPIDVREWMRLVVLELTECDDAAIRASLRSTPAADQLCPSNTKFKQRRHNRKNATRDATFLQWSEQGMKFAAIRDKWNKENPKESIPTNNQCNGRDIVKTAIKREKHRRGMR